MKCGWPERAHIHTLSRTHDARNEAVAVNISRVPPTRIQNRETVLQTVAKSVLYCVCFFSCERHPSPRWPSFIEMESLAIFFMTNV